MENKKVEIGKSRGNQIQGVKAVIEIDYQAEMEPLNMGGTDWIVWFHLSGDSWIQEGQERKCEESDR